MIGSFNFVTLFYHLGTTSLFPLLTMVYAAPSTFLTSTIILSSGKHNHRSGGDRTDAVNEKVPSVLLPFEVCHYRSAASGIHPRSVQTAMHFFLEKTE